MIIHPTLPMSDLLILGHSRVAVGSLITAPGRLARRMIEHGREAHDSEQAGSDHEG